MKPLETLLRSLVELHPDDAARAFEALNADEAKRLFRALPTRIVIALLARLSPHVAGPLLRELETARLSELLAAMPSRSAAVIAQQLDAEQRTEVLKGLPDKVAGPLHELTRYSAQTAGGIMEPHVAALAIDLTAQQAIAAIRKAPREALYYLYVTDRNGCLVGVLNMRDLLLAAPRDPVAPLVRHNVVSVLDSMDREAVVKLMTERKLLALPVVDYENRLIGVVKHDEALQAGQVEAFEDLQKLVGAGAEERALSPVRMVVKSRLPWLYVNLLTAFMAAAVVGLFEGTIAKVAALAVLLPVVAGQGGNTGSQSLAVVMRGLALREIIAGAKKRVVVKELVGGVINGVAVALVTAVAVFGWRAAAGDTVQAGIGLSLVIGLAMIVNMGAAALAGAIIPLVLRALGRDPAQSAAIFLTTVTDIVGFGSFLGFATLFMPMIA